LCDIRRGNTSWLPLEVLPLFLQVAVTLTIYFAGKLIPCNGCAIAGADHWRLLAARASGRTRRHRSRLEHTSDGVYLRGCVQRPQIWVYAKRLNMMRIMAMNIQASSLLGSTSESLESLRHVESQAKVRSTIQRCGST